jgi:nucleoside-diphosphate-sugar epimerase
MKKILVIGGAGFIGANLVRKLVSENKFNVSVIEPQNANPWRLKDVLDKVKIYNSDITKKDELEKTLDGIQPNIIFHLASYGVYPAIQNDLDRMIETNIKGTINLANLSMKYKPELFVNTGTCSEYQEKDGKLGEGDSVGPTNFYGITKLAATMLLQKIATTKNLSVVNLRLFTPFGYFEDGQRLIPYIILQTLKGEKVELTSPNFVRDFIFIEDLVDAFIKVLESKNNFSGEIFNIGSGKQHSIQEVVAAISKAMGKDLDVSYGNRQSYYKEPKSFVANNNKAAKEFNWKTENSFESAIEKNVIWFKENKNLYLTKD